jgi:O-antigen ligase
MVALVLVVLLYALLQVTQQRPAHTLVVLLVCVVLVLALPPLMNLTRPQTPSPTLAGGTTSETFLQTRLLLWTAAARMVQDRPVFGWGAGNFGPHVHNYLSEEESERLCRLEFGLGDADSVRMAGNLCAFTNPATGEAAVSALTYPGAHNVIMDELVSHGAVGLMLLLLFWLVLLRSVFFPRGRRGLVALLPNFGYLVVLLVWVYAVPVTPFAWMVLGLVVGGLEAETRSSPAGTLPNSNDR